jgi:ribonuclease HI
MADSIQEFRKERQLLNELVLEQADIVIKRFFSLDNQTYREGALPEKYKELMGLVASMVLRCDDCISYHIDQAFQKGVTREEFVEATGIALIVGGSIVIPHVRRAFRTWKQVEEESNESKRV